MSSEKRVLLTDYLHPTNPIFRNAHKLGDTLLGPGDPNCVLCKGKGIVVNLKCSCQDNYLIQLINHAEENNIPLVQYYGEPLTNYSENQLDVIFGHKTEEDIMDGGLTLEAIKRSKK